MSECNEYATITNNTARNSARSEGLEAFGAKTYAPSTVKRHLLMATRKAVVSSVSRSAIHVK